MAETSDEISALAARYARMTKPQLQEAARNRPTEFAADIRSMAASLLRQDETKGLRGLIKRVLG